MNETIVSSILAIHVTDLVDLFLVDEIKINVIIQTRGFIKECKSDRRDG